MTRAFALTAAVLALAVSLGAGSVSARDGYYEEALSKDMAGAKDHPWTGRYGGSTLLLQSTAAFDELTLPAGPAEFKGDKRFTKTVRAEGQVTRTVYAVPPGRSTLEVIRNFEEHLRGQGFGVVFSCSGTDECGQPFKELKYHWNNKASHVSGGAASSARGRLSPAVFDGGRDIRYALLSKGEGPDAAYVALFVARSEGGSHGDISKALTGYVLALVEVVQPGVMEQRIETVKSEAIAAGLQNKGAVALYGLFFDTDKAELKPESEPQLAEMVRYLKTSKAKVYVVGHTDSQGKLDYNLDLSDRRAKAVAAALVARGVPAGQMLARGVGPLVPAAPNSDEAGRAKNRRVELVLQ